MTSGAPNNGRSFRLVIGSLTAFALVAAAYFLISGRATTDTANAETVANTAPAASAAAAANSNGLSADAQKLLTIHGDDVVMGDANAPVTIIEYASLSCSHCAHFNNDVLPALEEKYIATGKVKLVNRPFPLNEPALRAAQLAQCGGKDRYYDFLKVLFKSQEQWATHDKFLDSLKSIAGVGGVSAEAFDTCIADKKLEESILTSRKNGAEVLKVESTPTFFINGVLYKDAYSVEAFSKALDEKLK